MAVSATVTPGVVLSENEEVTISKLNALGTPTVDVSGAVGTLSLAAGSVTNTEIATSAAIQHDKLAALSTGQLIVGNAGTPTAATVSGDVTIAADGAVTVADNAITPAKLEDGTQGDVLVYGASGAPERLGTGTSGQVLTAGGTGATASWTTPSDSTPVQLVQFFDSGADEDWTVPTGVTRVKVSVQAGGGAGYTSTTSGNFNDDGGAGGAYFEKTFSVTAGETIAVVAAADVTGNNAGSGGGPYSATNGNNSSIIYDSVTYEAGGGGGGMSNNSEVAGGSVTGTVDISVGGRSNYNGGFPGSGYLGQYGAGGYNAASPSTSSDIGHGGFVKIEY